MFRPVTAKPDLVGQEDAMVAQQIERLEVVAGHDDVDAGHHEDDRRETGDGHRLEANSRPPEPTTTARFDGIEERGDAVGIDDRREAVEEGDDVEDEDRRQEPWREDEPDEIRLARPEDDACEERDDEDRRRGKAECTLVGPRVGMAETGKDEGEDRRDERRTRPPTRLLRWLHRG